ncbi:hypothetical protein [Jeotgalibacillus sp. JSM ZJ347]|uniref:hypothetical protein n=1 Tax=Jeotgalibacillus sp. JSM ZJ347 TaxID=3342117 RepID=UPI0035A84647
MDTEHILKQDIVLSREKIAKVQQYLSVKYPEASSKKRAALLSQTLHEMIARSLPDFEDAEKVRISLFEKMIQSGEMKLSRYDLAEASIDYISKPQLIEWFRQHEIDEQLSKHFYPEEVETSDEPAVTVNSKPVIKPMIIGVTLLISFVGLIFSGAFNEAEDRSSDSVNRDFVQIEPVDQGSDNELPQELQFEKVNQAALQDWLLNRESMLADDPYFSAIYQAAYEFNVHPYLLFAITGQEQGFVQKDHPNAEEIANNPFNVFHSWEDFNTTIEESSEIAARTVVNLSEGRPENYDAIQWINRKYAEDPEWWIGVKVIFEKMKKEANNNTNS